MSAPPDAIPAIHALVAEQLQQHRDLFRATLPRLSSLRIQIRFDRHSGTPRAVILTPEYETHLDGQTRKDYTDR